MKRIITGILLLVMLTTLTGCVSKATYESVQQDLSTAEEAVSDQQAEIAELNEKLDEVRIDKANATLEIERGRSAELASSLEQTGAELEETQTTLTSTEVALDDEKALTRDIRAQLVDAQGQIEAISETPFGLYSIIDTPDGHLLWSPSDESSEVLIDGYVLIRNDDDVKSRYGVRDDTLGHWVLVGASSLGVEVDRDVLSGLITGPGLYSKTVAAGYQEICEKWGGTHSAETYGSIVWTYIPCTWKSGLGWVSDYPVRVLEHPLVEYHINDFYGHAVSPQFEILEPTMQFMTLALDPELIVQARESAAEAGVDFEEWLTEAILAKIR